MPSLERSVATLKDREFLVQTGPSELRFASPLIPEIVADALTPEAAREMHAAAGQALESTLGDRAWEHAARIAGHLYEAGDRERAAAYFAKSGERRLEAKQLEAAARDYARAIDPGRHGEAQPRGAAYAGSRRSPRRCGWCGRRPTPSSSATASSSAPTTPIRPPSVSARALRQGSCSRRPSTWKRPGSASPTPRRSRRATSSSPSRCCWPRASWHCAAATSRWPCRSSVASSRSSSR